MCIEDDIRERIENSEAFKKLIEACKQFAEAGRQAIEVLADNILPIAEQIGRIFGEILDAADIDVACKTDPPRIPVRCIGCKPSTKSRRATRCYIRTGHRHK